MFASIRNTIIQLFTMLSRLINATDQVVATAELHATALRKETEIEINARIRSLEKDIALLEAPAQ